jgi:hypothetical protein
MLNKRNGYKLKKIFSKKKFNITCQKALIQQIYQKNFTMDKKTLQTLNEKIKQGLKNNYPINDDEKNWISVVEAAKITGLTRPMLYNLINEKWFETRKKLRGKQEILTLFKPHVLTYSTQLEIIEELIKSKYIKEEIDKVTGKRRYLEFQTSASKIGELELAVKWRSVYQTYLKLQDLFSKIEPEELTEQI